MVLAYVVALLVSCLAVLGFIAAVISEIAPQATVTRKALVFQGGGARGAYQVGTLRRLCERGKLQNVQHLVGTSIGAMNAAYLAQFSSDKLCDGVDSLSKVWGSINSSEDLILASTRPGRTCAYHSIRQIVQLLATTNFLGRYPCTMQPAYDLYRRYINMSLIEQSGITFDAAMVSLEDGHVHYCSDMTCIEASGTLAPIVVPVRTPIGRSMDGGIRANCPLLRALHRGANDVHVLFTYRFDPPALASESYLKGYARFFLDVLFDEQLMDAIQYACLKYPHARISADIPVGDTGDLLDFDPVHIQKLIVDGHTGRRVSVPDICKYMEMDRSQEQPSTHFINDAMLAIGFLLLCAAVRKVLDCLLSDSRAVVVPTSARMLSIEG